MSMFASKAGARLAAIVFALLLLAGGNVWARRWTTVTDEKFEADFVRVEGPNGIFEVKGKEYPYPLNRLSIADRLFVGKIVNRTKAPAPTAAAEGIALAGQALKPGGETVLTIPLNDPDELREAKKAYGKSSDQARLLIAVPNDFAPETKSYPLLVVSASADGAGSSVDAAHQYTSAALGKGFVVLAVDGQFGKPPEDSIDFRWALVSAAVAAVEKEWPQAKDWPIATAGSGGGGGYASHQALKLIEERARVSGIFLAASAWNPTSLRDDFQRVPISGIRDLPIFLSAEDRDPIATPRITASYQSLLKSGFKKIRLEHFSGDQKLNLPHLATALDWFLAEAKK
jgi:hypothetical protein